MFHLNPGIHFHKIKFPFRAYDIFDGAGVGISHRFGRQYRIFIHFLPDAVVNGRGRGFLDKLLMVSLNGTVPFPQGHHIPLGVCHDLDLHMAGILDITFQVHGIVPKCIGRLPLGQVELELKLFLAAGHPHPFAPSAGRSLDYHRIPDFLRHFLPGFRVIYRIPCPRNHRHARVHHGLPCLGFIPHLVDYIRIRPDKGQAVFFTFPDKGAVFREEAEPRMDGIRVHIQRRADNAVHIQVAVLGRALPHTNPLVCQLGMQAVFVLF